MGILEREALAAHLDSYKEGYIDGFKDGQRQIGGPVSIQPRRGNPHPKKRRKTAYQSAFSAAYKRLKKKHPRMSFGSLSKKAHAAARKKVK